MASNGNPDFARDLRPRERCVTMIFSPTSTPNLSQLDGTIFVLIHVDLKLSVTVSPSTATTGTTVTVSAALTSVASVARRVTVTGTFTYTSPNGRRFSFSLPTLSGTVGAGQTFARRSRSKSLRFCLGEPTRWSQPRVTYWVGNEHQRVDNHLMERHQHAEVRARRETCTHRN